MVIKLKKHNINFTEKGTEEPLQAIDNINSQFDATIQHVFIVKAEILPL